MVSTAIGCEGLQATGGRELVMADHAFAQAVAALLTDSRPAEGLAANGRGLARATYDWQIVGQQPSMAVERLLIQRPPAGIRVSGESVFISQPH